MNVAGAIRLAASPLGRWVLGGLALLAVVWIIYDRGHAAGIAECRRDALEAQIAALERDRAAAAAVAARTEAALTEARALNENNQDRIDAYEAQLAQAGDACLADPADVDFLRGVN